ncbi:MAG: F0F1 ATP synthase subunit gamma [Candidatus Omnitrophota bacterium]
MKAREIKEELLFNSEFMGLLEVMKNIAISQFQSLQKRKKRFAQFIRYLDGFFQMMDIRKAPHRFINPRADKRAAVLITSDEGFMGDLNFQVVDGAIRKEGPEADELIVVGESGARYLGDHGKKFTAFRGAADAEGRRVLAAALRGHIVKGVNEDRFGRVTVHYPDPVSFMIQKVEALDLLPLSAIFLPDRKSAYYKPVIMESPVEGIIEYLAEEFIEQKLTELLEDSKLSEFAARASHLEKSGQELMDKQKFLSAQYFRAYHEIIDKNTRELFSSQLILKRKARAAVSS